jgi:hypothetical protein
MEGMRRQRERERERERGGGGKRERGREGDSEREIELVMSPGQRHARTTEPPVSFSCSPLKSTVLSG